MLEIAYGIILLCIVVLFLIVPRIYLFYDPNCTHCVRMRPEWDKFKRMVAADNRYLYIAEIDVTTNYLAAIYGVYAVPTILKIQYGKKTVYDLPRDAYHIHKWATSDAS